VAGKQKLAANRLLVEVEIFIALRPINHYPQTGKLPSPSATPELRQLLTSSLAS
jgi:hypothetical protein